MINFEGRLTKRQLEKMIFEESQNVRHQRPLTIPVSKENKLKLKHKKAIGDVIADKNFLGGSQEVSYRLKEHSNEDLRIDVCKRLVRKETKAQGFNWKNTRTTKKEPGVKRRRGYVRRKPKNEESAE